MDLKRCTPVCLQVLLSSISGAAALGRIAPLLHIVHIPCILKTCTDWQQQNVQVVEELVSNIGVVEKLQNFQYKDVKGKDWGLNVRNRAKELANFVLNPDRVRSERAKVCNLSYSVGTAHVPH